MKFVKIATSGGYATGRYSKLIRLSTAISDS